MHESQEMSLVDKLAELFSDDEFCDMYNVLYKDD